MSILEKINSSEDVKKLNKDELPQLCAEIREFLLKTVSRNGGHLASNLGTVELTVALHRVYDSRKDRIVFDVGHQSYTHKIITGRREQFGTLRQHGGISGFPKPYESVDDAFIAGHASDSVSVALGMARARTIQKENYDVVAVIGDGALTGGLAMEGLANAAVSKEPLLIIINDNNKSIGDNVGGFHLALQRLRLRPWYIRLKTFYRNTVGKSPALYGAFHKVKEKIKGKLLPSDLFTDMGYYYLGPVDGHDLEELERSIRWARDQRIPVILHVLTQKGRGYAPAVENPEVYHGVGAFDLAKGLETESGHSFSDCFGETLCELAEENPKVSAITAAMSLGTGLLPFSSKFPERFFDVGIAEEHAVSMAAAMAKQGLVPVFAVYSSFLQRSYDMMLQDIGLLHLHVVLGVDRSGLVGSDGETHHGVFDVSYLCAVPGMTVFCPASNAELSAMLRIAVNDIQGPAALRYPRGGELDYKECHTEEETVLREGSDITLVSYGILINEVLKAAELLKERGISAEVIKLNRICPCTFEKSAASVKKTGALLVAEETAARGCIGEELICSLAIRQIPCSSYTLLNLGNGIVSQGTVPELYRDCGIDAESIEKSAMEALMNEKSKA